MRIAVSVSSPSGEGFGTSTQFRNGSTWRELLDGLCDVLAHHRLENPYDPYARLSPCAVVVQWASTAALVMSEHPMRRGRRPSIWTRVSETEDSREAVSWLRRLELRALSCEACGNCPIPPVPSWEPDSPPGAIV
ncbi:hypothetical protein Pth03_49110 [Planotetraspora thailandica]|uniref:Uncharacterized protein n=1 Tax=Planotetraspora thailandica TaxID=487172 RepID=A0A8J3V366_9ACTN|nr:hypothetical protein Pth03_49110 [Planotetraspora thailandica]